MDLAENPPVDARFLDKSGTVPCLKIIRPEDAGARSAKLSAKLSAKRPGTRPKLAPTLAPAFAPTLALTLALYCGQRLLLEELLDHLRGDRAPSSETEKAYKTVVL